MEICEEKIFTKKKNEQYGKLENLFISVYIKFQNELDEKYLEIRL